jgi:hypothetical protein
MAKSLLFHSYSKFDIGCFLTAKIKRSIFGANHSGNFVVPLVITVLLPLKGRDFRIRRWFHRRRNLDVTELAGIDARYLAQTCLSVLCHSPPPG